MLDHFIISCDDICIWDINESLSKINNILINGGVCVILLYQEIMERQSLTGQKLRQEVNKIVEMAKETEFCSCCPKTRSDGFCTFCLRRILVNKLREKGLNANLCTSKWKHTKEIPGGMKK